MGNFPTPKTGTRIDFRPYVTIGSLYKHPHDLPEDEFSGSYDVSKWRHRRFYWKFQNFRGHDLEKFLFRVLLVFICMQMHFIWIGIWISFPEVLGVFIAELWFFKVDTSEEHTFSHYKTIQLNWPKIAIFVHFRPYVCMGSLYKYSHDLPGGEVSWSNDVTKWRHRRFYWISTFFRGHDLWKFLFRVLLMFICMRMHFIWIEIWISFPGNVYLRF